MKPSPVHLLPIPPNFCKPQPDASQPEYQATITLSPFFFLPTRNAAHYTQLKHLPLSLSLPLRRVTHFPSFTPAPAPLPAPAPAPSAVSSPNTFEAAMKLERCNNHRQQTLSPKHQVSSPSTCPPTPPKKKEKEGKGIERTQHPTTRPNPSHTPPARPSSRPDFPCRRPGRSAALVGRAGGCTAYFC